MSSRVSRSALRKRRTDVPNVKVGIVGLNRITGSIGLGLRAYSENPAASVTFTVIGRDLDKEAMKTAHANGMIDDYHRTLAKVVSEADIVFVSESLSQLESLFEHMAAHLKDGVVVIDLSPLKRPGARYAKKYFRKDLDGNLTAYLVGATPMIGFDRVYNDQHGVEGADEFLFRSNDMLLAPAPSVPPEAVKVATDLSEFLGMKPRFVDPMEHDGLASMTEGIPTLLSTLYLQMVQQSRGKRDIERAGNAAFASTLDTLRHLSGEDMVALWRENKTSMLLHMEALMKSMETMMEMLRSDLDEPGIMEAYMNALLQTFVAWEVKREKNRWDEPQESALDNISAGIGMMSPGFGSRRKRDDDE